MNAQTQQLFHDFAGHAFARGGIFAIRDDKIEPFEGGGLPASTQKRECSGQNRTAGTPHDGSDEQDSNYFAYSVERISRDTVTLIWPGYFISSSIFRAMS